MEINPIEEIEHKIYLACSPNAVQGNEAKIPEAREFVKNIKNSPDGLNLCLSNYSLFKLDASKFTLDILVYWLEFRFSEIPPPIVSAIFDFLTTTAIDQFSKLDLVGVETLAEAQAIFTIKTYLEIFPGVIEKFYLFGRDKKYKAVLLRYISHLFKQLTTPSPLTLQLHQLIIQRMQQDGSIITLSEITQNEIQRRNMVALEILIYYARFLDISFLNEDILIELAEDLDDEMRDKSIPLVYLSLLQRQDSIDSKKSLMELTNLNEVLANFCANAENYPELVVLRMGTLLSFVGYSFENDQNYYNLALQLGSLTVLNYINLFTLNHPEFLSSTLNFAIARLRTYFSAQFVYDTYFVQSLQEICLNCFILNQETSEKVLITFVNSFQTIMNDLPSLLTLLLIILAVLQSKLNIVQMQSFIHILTQLFQNVSTTPLFDNQNSSLYAVLFSIILIFDERYPSPVLFPPYQILGCLVPFTLNPNFYQRKFQKLLFKCCLKYGVQNNINEVDLNVFLQPIPFTNGKIYGSLINCVPIENRAAMVQQTIAKVLEALKNPTDDLILFTLSIFSSLKCPLESQCLQSVTGFIQSMLSNPAILNNDFILSKAIKAISSLNLSGTQIFLQFYPNVASIRSLTALANLASSIRRIATLEKSALAAEIPNDDPGLSISLDNSWVAKFTSFLISNLQNFAAEAPLYESDELGSYFTYISSVVSFMSNELSNVVPQDIMILATIILDGANIFYDSPEMNRSLLKFGLVLSNINDPEIGNILIKYLQVSLNFVYTPNIVLLSNIWIHVLIDLIKFYQRLNVIMPPAFQENVSSIAQAIGGKPQSIQTFLTSLTNFNPDFLYPLLNYAANFCYDLILNMRYV